jgi:hypothetical protein
MGRDTSSPGRLTLFAALVLSLPRAALAQSVDWRSLTLLYCTRSRTTFEVDDRAVHRGPRLPGRRAASGHTQHGTQTC